MKKEYDFSNGKRDAVIPRQGKTRISIYIDNDILDEFRRRADEAGKGYQTMINDALKANTAKTDRALDEPTLRRIFREELEKGRIGVTDMNKRIPTHPGALIREDVLRPLGLTVTRAAELLGVTQKTLSELINESASLSTEMALRIAKATGTTPESWLTMQQKLDLWNARQKEPDNVARFPMRIPGRYDEPVPDSFFEDLPEEELKAFEGREGDES